MLALGHVGRPSEKSRLQDLLQEAIQASYCKPKSVLKKSGIYHSRALMDPMQRRS